MTRRAARATQGEGASVSDEFPKIGINTKELLAEIERLLKKAAKTRSDFGAVNWGDLGVADIEYRMSVLTPGTPYCVVIIEEASPDCKLPSWIDERLDKTRFNNVYVECEW